MLVFCLISSRVLRLTLVSNILQPPKLVSPSRVSGGRARQPSSFPSDKFTRASVCSQLHEPASLRSLFGQVADWFDPNDPGVSLWFLSLLSSRSILHPSVDCYAPNVAIELRD